MFHLFFFVRRFPSANAPIWRKIEKDLAFSDKSCIFVAKLLTMRVLRPSLLQWTSRTAPHWEHKWKNKNGIHYKALSGSPYRVQPFLSWLLSEGYGYFAGGLSGVWMRWTGRICCPNLLHAYLVRKRGRTEETCWLQRGMQTGWGGTAHYQR